MSENVLTPEQVRDIAMFIQTVANDLADYQLDEFHGLSKKEQQRLTNLEITLNTVAHEVRQVAAEITWVNMQIPLKGIIEATDKMRTARQEMTTFTKAIRIAAGVLSIGGAIVAVAGDPTGVLTATASFVNLFDQFKNEANEQQKAEDEAHDPDP